MDVVFWILAVFDLDAGVEYILGKLAGIAKLEGAANFLEK